MEVVLPTPLTPITRVSMGPRPEGRGRGISESRSATSSDRSLRSRAALVVCSLRAFFLTRSTSSSEVSTPRSAPMRISSRYSMVRSSRATLPLIASETLSMISVWVMKSPRCSFFQNPRCSSSSSARRISGASSRRSGFLLSLGVAWLRKKQLTPELLDGAVQCLQCMGDQGGMALDKGQVVAIGQRDYVDMEGLLLDMDHASLAQVVVGEDLVELPQVDAQVGTDDPQLVRIESGAAGEVHRLAGAVEEQGAESVIVVGQQVGEDVLVLHPELRLLSAGRQRPSLPPGCPRCGKDAPHRRGSPRPRRRGGRRSRPWRRS